MAKKRGSIRPGTLARMSNDQLKRQGYIRIAGFTKKNGDKVKSHIRKLSPREMVDKASEEVSTMSELNSRFVPDKDQGVELGGKFSKPFEKKSLLTELKEVGSGYLRGASEIPGSTIDFITKILPEKFETDLQGKTRKVVDKIFGEAPDTSSVRGGRSLGIVTPGLILAGVGGGVKPGVGSAKTATKTASKAVKGVTRSKSASSTLKGAKPTKSSFDVPTRSVKESNKAIARQTKLNVERRLARGRPQKGGPYDRIKRRETLIDQELKQGKGWTLKELDKVPVRRGNIKAADNTVNANMTRGFANKPKITSKSFDASFGNAPKSKVVMNPGKKPGNYRNMAEMQAAGKANIKAAVAKARAPMGKSKLVPKKGTTSTIAKDAPKGKPAGFKPKNFAELQARQKAGLKAQANKVNTKPKTLKQKALALEKKVLAKEKARTARLASAKKGIKAGVARLKKNKVKTLGTNVAGVNRVSRATGLKGTPRALKEVSTNPRQRRRTAKRKPKK